MGREGGAVEVYLFRVKVYGFAGHVLCQTEDLHLLADGGLNDFLEGVFGMARAELARVAVVGEWHCVSILSWVMISLVRSDGEKWASWTGWQ